MAFLWMFAEIASKVYPSENVNIGIEDDAENRNCGESPCLCMLIERDKVVSSRRFVRHPRLHLKGCAQAGDNAVVVPEINVAILAEVILPCDFLKNAQVSLEKCLHGVDAVSTCDTL